MDEKEFLKTQAKVNDRPCAFSKALLRQCCGCSRSQKLFIGGREVVACKSPGAHDRCTLLLATLHHKSVFALHLTHNEGSLPHGKEIKVQCGAMLGLASALSPQHATEPSEIADIYTLIDRAEAHFGSLASIPYSELVKGITHFKSRPRG